MKYLVYVENGTKKLFKTAHSNYKDAEKKATELRSLRSDEYSSNHNPIVKIEVRKTGYIRFEKAVFKKYLPISKAYFLTQNL